MKLHDLGELEWAKEPLNYLTNTHLAIVSRFEQSLRYVSLHRDNGNTFSYEFASILRDVASAFGSFTGEIIKASDQEKVWAWNKPDIKDYRNFYLKIAPGLPTDFVELSGFYLPDRLLNPFWEWEDKTAPGWWNAYNKIKHSEYKHADLGNLQNVTNAIAAVDIILKSADFQRGSDFFTWVGHNWNPDGPANQNLRPLFDQ